MRRTLFLFAAAVPLALQAQNIACDLLGYKAADGLRASNSSGGITLEWTGENREALRAAFAIEAGAPVVRELAARNAKGVWTVLGRDLKPEFDVTSGIRRLSEQQMAPLRELGIKLTPDVVEREKWNAFWDAPLSIPGRAGTNLDLPRKPGEIRRAKASFQTSGCRLATDGARLELSFDGLRMGIFSGRLEYTVYRGSNLLRQEAVASTNEPSVAYKYDGGLSGFAINDQTKLIWRDTARAWQQYEFGGAVNHDAVGLRARNRLAVLETGGGSLVVLPPSHKFFFAREMETNLGYVYYRKDSPSNFAIGIRQPEREEGYKPFGVSDAVWNRRVAESRGELQNFALYNAPPGTEQHMPVYFYLYAGDGRAAQERVL